MSLIKQRTNDLHEEIKDKIQNRVLNSVDEVAEAIVKGADTRSVVFGKMKDAAAFQMMSEIDSESLYQLVEGR